MENALHDLMHDSESPEVMISLTLNSTTSLHTRISIDRSILSGTLFRKSLVDYLGILIYNKFYSQLDHHTSHVTIKVSNVSLDIPLKLADQHDTDILDSIEIMDDISLGQLICLHSERMYQPTAGDREILTACIALGIVRELAYGTPGYNPGDPVYLSA